MVTVRRGDRPRTITDVAKHGGVSPATVSYVPNGRHPTRIPARTQDRVRASAAALNYVPQGDARSLRRGRSDLVIAHHGYDLPRKPMVAAGLVRLSRVVAEAGYTLVVQGDPGLTGVGAARMWARLRPSAVIAFSDAYTPAGVELLATMGVVTVGVGTTPPPPGVLAITFDDSAIGRLAADHLADGGRRDAVLLEPAGIRHLGVPLRSTAFRETAEGRGMRVRAARIGSDPADAAQLVRSWAGDLPDAVYGADTEHAALVLQALVDAGVRVPGEVAVVGALDEPLCELVRPRLTAVAVDVTEPSSQLAEPVLAALRGEWDPALAVRVWTGELHARGSSLPAYDVDTVRA